MPHVGLAAAGLLKSRRCVDYYPMKVYHPCLVQVRVVGAMPWMHDESAREAALWDMARGVVQ
jgi:hypothetical protein